MIKGRTSVQRKIWECILFIGGLCLLILFCNWNKEDVQPLGDVNEIKKVDISYTFETFEDGTYHILLSRINILEIKEDILHIEYPMGEVISSDITLELKEGDDQKQTYGRIAKFPIGGNCVVQLLEDKKEVSDIVDIWKDNIKKNQYVLEIKLESQEITALRIFEY